MIKPYGLRNMRDKSWKADGCGLEEISGADGSVEGKFIDDRVVDGVM